MRLQKFLAQAQVASRRGAEELIAAGAVRVNGEVVKTPGTSVKPGVDRVEVEGKRVKAEAPLYRLLLKPRACLATLGDRAPADDDDGERARRDERAKERGKPPQGRAGEQKVAAERTGEAGGKPAGARAAGRPAAQAKPPAGGPPRATLARYVSDRAIGWKVVAPLDYPSEGVLLLTTDGDLAEKLSRGGGRVPMTYHIKYQGVVGDEQIGRLLRGWKWERRTIKPDTVVALATTGKNTWVELVVREMRPRALKASGEAIHRHVLKISRVRLGHLSFEGLAMGGHRDLSKAEVKGLRRAAGLEE